MPVIVADGAWTPQGWMADCEIAWDDGVIVRVGPPTGVPSERLKGKSVTPGAVNAHSHAFQRGLRGRVQSRTSENDDFWSWREGMYALADSLSPDAFEALVAQCFLEMLEAGITTVGEFHYLHHGLAGHRYADPDELAHRVRAAAEQVGLRVVLLRTAYYRAGPGRDLVAPQLRFVDRDPTETLASIERLKRIPGWRVGLALHSVRAVPPTFLRELRAYDGLVHAHVAEVRAEVEACKQETGAEPLACFEDAGWLGPQFTAVHLTRPGPGDVARMAQSGAGVCATPSTELDLGDGWVPLAWIDGPLCVGSDSQAAIDPVGEARAVEMGARGRMHKRNVWGRLGDESAVAQRIMDVATTSGDRALGGNGAGLVPGGPADFVAWDLDRPAADGVPPLEAIAFASRPEWVSDVWVGGRRVVSEGRAAARDAVRRRFSQPARG